MGMDENEKEILKEFLPQVLNLTRLAIFSMLVIGGYLQRDDLLGMI